MLTALTAENTFPAAPNQDGTTAPVLLPGRTGQERITPSGPESTSAEEKKDVVTLSRAGIEQSRQAGPQRGEETASGSAPLPDQGRTNPPQEKASGQKTHGANPLTPDQQRVLLQLQQRDREVRVHEQAHLATAGQYARGGPSFSYQTGPDGQQYAIGGEVPIDISKESTPEATIQKMETIQRAALAPADPSSADRSIASAAAGQENKARQELRARQASALRAFAGSGQASPATSSTSKTEVQAGSPAARGSQRLDLTA